MRLFKRSRSKVWWVYSHGVRASTGCTDRVAAEFWALGYERARVLIHALETDSELRGHVERYIDRTREARSKGWLYVMHVGGRVKIGFTSKPVKARLATMQTAHAEPVELIASFAGTRADEKAAHKALAHARIAGEWFDGGDAAVLAWIRDRSASFDTVGPARSDVSA